MIVQSAGIEVFESGKTTHASRPAESECSDILCENKCNANRIHKKASNVCVLQGSVTSTTKFAIDGLTICNSVYASPAS